MHEGDETLYDTALDVFPQRGRWEWYQTSGFKELASIYGVTENSYHTTSRRLNRLRHQSEHDGTPSRSLQAQAEREGTRLLTVLDRKATHILDAAHVSDQDGIVSLPDQAPPPQPLTMPQERVEAARATCRKSLKDSPTLSGNPVPYEAPEFTVNISVDNVGVKRQKAKRRSSSASSATPPSPDQSSTSRKYAHTTTFLVGVTPTTP